MATAPKPVPKAVPKAVPKTDAEEVAPPVKKSKKKLFIILGVLLLAVAGGSAAFFMKGAEAPAGEEAGKEVKHKAEVPVFVVIDSFTVNLQAETGEQFLQAGVTFQVSDQKDAENFKLYMPLVRSRLLLLLSGKKASEISTVAGKKKLSEEILAQMKMPFAGGGEPQQIIDVFFTSFVIQ
jgi:flagellar FliL protein